MLPSNLNSTAVVSHGAVLWTKHVFIPVQISESENFFFGFRSDKKIVTDQFGLGSTVPGSVSVRIPILKTGSGQKTESEFRSPLNPDPNCFLTLPGIKIKLF